MLSAEAPKYTQQNLLEPEDIPGPEPERFTRSPAEYAAELHGGGLGTVAVGRKNRNTGRVYQRRMPVEAALGYARSLAGDQDRYVSMNRYGDKLGTEGLISLQALYADLDYYNNHHRAQADPKAHPYEIAELALDKLRAEGIPSPTHAIASGRGVHLVWQFSPIRPEALPRWRRAARRISEVLREFGADAAVGNDPARVLRLPGTTNSANGGQVEPLLPIGEVYRFGPLCDRILPRTQAQIHDLQREQDKRRERGEVAPQRRSRPANGYGGETVNEGKIRDYHRNRGHRGGRAMSDGRRMWMHHYACAAAWLAPSVEALREDCRRVGAEVAGWSPSQTDAALSTVFSKTEAAHRGETVEHRGREVDPRYRYTTERIIDDLHITPAEQREMEVLIDGDERRRRRRRKAEKRRRRAGSITRREYEDRAAQRRTQARRMAAEGYARAEIAAALGVSKPAVTNYLREPADPDPKGGSKSVSVYASDRRPCDASLAAKGAPEPAERTDTHQPVLPGGYGDPEEVDILAGALDLARPRSVAAGDLRLGAIEPGQEGPPSTGNVPRDPATEPETRVDMPIAGQTRITQPRESHTRPGSEVERGNVPEESAETVEAPGRSSRVGEGLGEEVPSTPATVPHHPGVTQSIPEHPRTPSPSSARTRRISNPARPERARSAATRQPTGQANRHGNDPRQAQLRLVPDPEPEDGEADPGETKARRHGVREP